MKKRLVIITAALVTVFAVSLALADTDYKIKGSHLKNEMTCEDCHLEAEPASAAKQDVCIDCHTDMTEAGPVKFKDDKGHVHEDWVHDSHESPIDCTACHKQHSPTVLYCNNCHTFDLKVP